MTRTLRQPLVSYRRFSVKLDLTIVFTCKNATTSLFKAVESVGDTGDPIIVIQNKDGDLVQGVTDLADLEHPDGAIYFFGGSLARMNEFDVLGADVKASVYIPIGPVCRKKPSEP